ncbi:MAG TPA: hypothetical protein VI653_16175 [Steroidobacteraceae bacterium]
MLLCALCLAVAACATPVENVSRIAAQRQLQEVVLPGFAGLQHQAYWKGDPNGGLLVVFIDGDGSPWRGGGTRVARDPSPKHSVALQLAASTPGSVLYLGRPCYLRFAQGLHCTNRLWTSDRYSEEVIVSMTQALRTYLRRCTRRPALVLVGYSGGGAIASLMARELPDVTALVTIAGNLDPETWTRLHHFLPLSNSLNPSQLPPPPSSVRQWHLVGTADTNVPYEAAKSYLERPGSGQVWRYAGFDHRCCWVREWPHAWGAIEAELADVALR